MEADHMAQQESKMKYKDLKTYGIIGREPASLFLTDSLTPYAAKIKAKTAAYEAKRAEKINVTPDNHEYIWNHLSQTLFAIDYASFHITALQRKSMFPDKDKIVEFAKLTEVKFNSFVACLNPEKQIEYRNARTEFEEFARQLSTFTDKERKRIYSMANKIENERTN